MPLRYNSQVRRLAALVWVLLTPTAAHAAGVTVSPARFSPLVTQLVVEAQLDSPGKPGVMLTSAQGDPLGWLVPPKYGSEARTWWDGTLAGRLVPQGSYRAALVVKGTTVASAPFRIDWTAPVLRDLRVDNGTTPFAGDRALLTTISPNDDGFRERAVVHFTLSEAATVTLQVQRTARDARTIYKQTVGMRAGEQSLTWAPGPNLPPRTYVLHLTARDRAGNEREYGAPNAYVTRYPRAPVVRVQGVDAGFTRPSYAAGQLAFIRVATDAVSFKLQFFQIGPDQLVTYADNLLSGIPVSDAITIDWRTRAGATQFLPVRIGAWESGVYYAQLTAPDGRIGYAPFVLRPPALGRNRVAVVVPTNTWQAYNYYDADGDGWGDTWYAGAPHYKVALDRPFLHRGVPPFYYRYDQGFLHWLYWTGKSADFLADSDFAGIADGRELADTYDLVVFAGHDEYVTDHAYGVVEQFRDHGGNLMFLSANDFYWRVSQSGWVLKRMHSSRSLGGSEASLLGNAYLGNDDGQRQGLFVVRNQTAAPWFWEGTELADGGTFGEAVGGYGIEIDGTSDQSPPGTIVLAEIPDLFGPGLTAQMTYYETAGGARVFSAGALDFGGSATTAPVQQLLENLWTRLSQP
jgi:hypothetical protein